MKTHGKRITSRTIKPPQMVHWIWTVLFICLCSFQFNTAFLLTNSVNQGGSLSASSSRSSRRLNFEPNKRGNSDHDNHDQQSKQGLISNLKRFIPSIIRKREISHEPEVDSGNRYHVRLVNIQPSERRHAITRTMRYIPDLGFDTAAEIVDVAIENKRSLLRVFNSLSHAKFVVDLLRKASPPVGSEIYDSKEDCLVVL